ncbi:glycoside hydrolase family 3 protein [Bowmanella denitrificans]|uniref:Glycoside hydrolase family 3 protein n=1 Tax=Bowmanella denitrificans TaxID=366582 RepID=A0ABN0XLK0_9ALTE
MQKNIRQLLDAMSLEEKVGQLFVLAFAGRDLDYASYLVRERHIGGFYLTDDNAATPEQAKQLATQLQHQASLRPCDAPLLLAVDQEGAWGILTKYLDLGPGNLALGKADDEKLTSEVYQMFARQIGALGYNCILGPCADVNTNPDNPIIGQRSFGEQPQAVARQVCAAVEGLHQGGLLACAKHFPGHGDTAEDSHQTLPVVDKSEAELLEQDLMPFQAAVNAGVDLVMTSHIRFPQLDSDLPATLSKPILTELLKQQMGFGGIIITDSMNMWAMRRQYDPVGAALMALEAGAHLVMLSEEHYENQSTDYKAIQKATLDGVIDAVRQGRVSETLLDSRLGEVLTMRYQKLQRPSSPLIQTQDGKLSVQAARQAIRRLRENKPMPDLTTPCYFIPLADPANQERLVNSRGIGPNDPRAASSELLKSLHGKLPELIAVEFPQLQAFLTAPDQRFADKPILAVWEDYPLPGEDFDPAQGQRLTQLLQQYPDNLHLLLLGPDYPLQHFSNVQSCICTYSSRWVSAQALAEFLLTRN